MVAGVLVLAQPSGQSAWAKQVIQRAEDVLAPAPAPDTILHVVATQTENPRALRDGPSVPFLSEEGWLQQGPPWNRHVIVHPAGGPVLEQGSAGQTYNMTSNELYPGPQLPNGKPRYTLLPGAKPGSYRLRVKLPHGGFTTSTITAAEANAIRHGTQTVSWAITWNGRVQQLQPLVTPSSRQLQQTAVQQPNAASSGFAAQLHGLLSSGHARVIRTTTVDGKPAIEISSVHPQVGPRTNYYVNPTTYAPIELDSYGYESPRTSPCSLQRLSRRSRSPVINGCCASPPHRTRGSTAPPPTTTAGRCSRRSDPAEGWRAVLLGSAALGWVQFD